LEWIDLKDKPVQADRILHSALRIQDACPQVHTCGIVWHGCDPSTQVGKRVRKTQVPKRRVGEKRLLCTHSIPFSQQVRGQQILIHRTLGVPEQLDRLTRLPGINVAASEQVLIPLAFLQFEQSSAQEKRRIVQMTRQEMLHKSSQLDLHAARRAECLPLVGEWWGSARRAFGLQLHHSMGLVAFYTSLSVENGRMRLFDAVV
jgi:hypothetical protein